MKRFWSVKCVCVSGHRRMNPLRIRTCTCPTTGRSLPKRKWRWSALAKWTSTSSPSTYRDATSPSALRCTAVSERLCGSGQNGRNLIPATRSFHSDFLPVSSVDEIRVFPFSNSSRATQFSREVIRTQGEWEFLQLTVTSQNFTIDNKQWEYLIYTVRMYLYTHTHTLHYVLVLVLELVFLWIHNREFVCTKF